MKNIIMDYFLGEKKMAEVAAKRMTEKISRHEDIRTEFENWIQNRTYISEQPLAIEGYTANDILKMAPFLDGAGVFNFMVTLRENPQQAKEYINSGFPRR